MLFLYIFLFISCVYSLEVKPIKSCVNCKHFIPNPHNNVFIKNEDITTYGKCKLFYELDILTGLKKLEFAAQCRNDNNKCGEEAEYYDKKLI
jgi:hypothetical protein